MLASGDRSAFEEIYNRYWQVLYQGAFRRLKSKELTEDVLQEVFARIWMKREKLQILDIGAYLHTAAYHESLRAITKSRQVTEFYQPFEELLAAANSPQEQLVARELLELIHAYAATLPAKRRAILLKHITTHLSTKEIAEELGISTKTVQNQLNTALTGLKNHLGAVLLLMIQQHL